MPKKKRIEKPMDIVIPDAELARIEVMAKLAVARCAALSVLENVDEALSYFIDPGTDKKGERRSDLIGAAEEALGDASIALTAAAERMSEVDTALGEPEVEEEDDDEEDEEEEDDSDDDEDEDDDEEEEDED